MTRQEAYDIQSDILKIDHVHYFDETDLTDKHGHYNIVIDHDINEAQRTEIDNLLIQCKRDPASSFPRGPVRISPASDTIPTRHMTKLRTHIPPPSRPNAWNNPLLPAPPLNQSSSTRAAITDVVTKEIHTGITILEERIQNKFRQMEQELEDYKKQAEEMNRTLVVYENQSKEVQQTVDGHEQRIKNTETIQTVQQQEIQDIRTDFNLNIESLTHTLTEKMEISGKTTDQKLEAMSTTLTSKMDRNHQSILAGIQQLLLRPQPAVPSPEAVAIPVHEAPSNPIAVPVTLTGQPSNRVDQDDESPRKRKSDFGDDIDARERPYNPEDDHQHNRPYQHQIHPQHHITPGNSQASK